MPDNECELCGSRFTPTGRCDCPYRCGYCGQPAVTPYRDCCPKHPNNPICDTCRKGIPHNHRTPQ